MDERRLTELFTEAADEAQRHAPPPRFEYADVVASRKRPKSRARAWQTSVAAGVVLITIVAGMAAIQMLGTNRPGTTLAAPGPPPRTATSSDSPPPSMFAEQTAPATPLAPHARSATPFEPAPGQRKRLATSSCARPDTRLLAALVEILPPVRRAVPHPLSDAVRCPEGARGLEVDVDDRGASGVLRVVLLPPRTGGTDASGQGDRSVLTASANTPTGARIVVSMTAPTGHRVPYANQLGPIAKRLATRF